VENFKIEEDPVWMEDFNRMNHNVKNIFPNMVRKTDAIVSDRLNGGVDRRKEELNQYLEKLNKLAQENNLAIGWVHTDKLNVYDYTIFVKDIHNNSWEDRVTTETFDYNALYKVWECIEELMMLVLKKR
jgi:hypothetical protein